MNTVVPLRNKQKRKSNVASKENLSIGLDIVAKTEPQRQMIGAFLEGYNVVAFGSAGSGKSFIACYLALKDLFEGAREKIVVVRSAVQTRDMGFLPGSLDEKAMAYQIPYKQIMSELCQNGTAWDILTKKHMVEFLTTSYIRGTTLSNCVVIIDEFQNMTWQELNSVVTRIGENCQVIICGDTKQCDLNLRKEPGGFNEFMRVANKLDNWFEMVEFMPQDIVRSEFVRDWIIASEEQ